MGLKNMVVAILFVLVGLILGETKPAITWKQCTKSGCTSQQGYLVSEYSWRWQGGDITYSDIGVSSNGDSVSQKLVTNSGVGSRLYLLQSNQQSYQFFNPVDKEFSFDTDLSTIPCGLNAGLYTVEMSSSGGSANLGEGYCDAQFLGSGDKGCIEFDLIEGNHAAHVTTTHACSQLGQFSKGQATCDSDGCAFNPYRYNKQFYGNSSSFTVDSSKKFTVVTQFIGSGSGSSLKEIRRLYVQNGRVINNVKYNNYDSISDAFCSAIGHNVNSSSNLQRLGESLARGHVLAFTLWDSDSMSWMDAGNNGPCNASEESSSYIEQHYPNATVTWSNIRFGELDSTY